jgi:uncharacterized protein YcaQ
MNLAQLRNLAVGRTLFSSATLGDALARLRFVQADPIRAPARAQDLILRLRVPGYRAGQLEKNFGALDLIEDMLHVYGFLPRREDAFLHPRRLERTWSVDRDYPHLRRAVLVHARRHGSVHPRDLHQSLGRASIASGWGQDSSATTRALEMLHYEGRLQVIRRESGIKVYGPAPVRERAVPARERARELLRILVNLYAPLPRSRLRHMNRMIGERSPVQALVDSLIEGLVRSGELCETTVDGVDYLLPGSEARTSSPFDGVRFLAPFDPIVWDRQRFEHLWGWPYRFEAYTPPQKRQFGYYALPLLWRNAVIGWANITRASGAWQIAPGFVATRPKGAAFAAAFESEWVEFQRFLGEQARA